MMSGVRGGHISIPPGTWQTFVAKEQSVWHKISKDTPIQYAASITVNPLSALSMLEDFVSLNSGDAIVQNGATSIVGQCIIQLAQLRGIHSINIIRDRDSNACRLVESLVKEIEWVTKLVTTAAGILIWNGVTFIKLHGRRTCFVVTKLISKT